MSAYPPFSLPLAEQKLSRPFHDLLDYWHQIRGRHPIPLKQDFDPFAISDLLPCLILFEVLRNRESLDFRFRVVGTYLDERHNGCYTGSTVTEVYGNNHGQIWHACENVAQTAAPELAQFPFTGQAQLAKEERITSVNALFLPLSEQGGRVDYILCLVNFTHAAGADRQTGHPA